MLTETNCSLTSFCWTLTDLWPFPQVDGSFQTSGFPAERSTAEFSFLCKFVPTTSQAAHMETIYLCTDWKLWPFVPEEHRTWAAWCFFTDMFKSLHVSPLSPALLRPPDSRFLAAVAVSPAVCVASVQAGRSWGGTACARRTSGESRPRSSSARSRTRKSATDEIHPQHKATG